MSDKKETLQNIDFDNLILESAQDADLEYVASGETLSKRSIVAKPLILINCIASLLLGALISIDSMHTTERVGSRGAEVQLGVALYHFAHRVETYKHRTGHLPDYPEPQWQESGEVEYRVTTVKAVIRVYGRSFFAKLEHYANLRKAIKSSNPG